MAARRGRPRDAQARSRVVATASELFVRQGFLATTVGEIATGAGVAVQTVYSAFGSKVGVLAGAHDVALAGDDEPVPLVERDWFTGLAAEPTAADAWRTAVGWTSRSTARVAPIYSAMLAAEADPDVAALMRETRAQRLTFSRALVATVLDRPGGEHADRRRVVDLVYALECVESFQLLVTQRGWSQSQWRAWVFDTVLREIEPST